MSADRVAANICVGDVPVGETFRFLDTERDSFWRRISDDYLLGIDPKTGGVLLRYDMNDTRGPGERVEWAIGRKAAARPVELMEFVPARWEPKNGRSASTGGVR